MNVLPSESSNTPTVEHLWFLEKLCEPDDSLLEMDDANIVYYVAGYIGRTIAARNKCEFCKTCLVLAKAVDLELNEHDQPPAESDGNVDREDMRQLLDMADRGGLVAPTEFTFSLCIFAYLLYKQITANEELEQQFLTSSHHCNVYLEIVKHFAVQQNEFFVLAKCSKDHLFFVSVVRKLFNCIAKNVMRKVNSRSTSVSSQSARKIRKLTSKVLKK